MDGASLALDACTASYYTDSAAFKRVRRCRRFLSYGPYGCDLGERKNEPHDRSLSLRIFRFSPSSSEMGLKSSRASMVKNWRQTKPEKLFGKLVTKTSGKNSRTISRSERIVSLLVWKLFGLFDGSGRVITTLDKTYQDWSVCIFSGSASTSYVRTYVVLIVQTKSFGSNKFSIQVVFLQSLRSCGLRH